jgi:hypothetical protein
MQMPSPGVPVDQIERLEAALRRHETLWQIVGCLEDIGLPAINPAASVRGPRHVGSTTELAWPRQFRALQDRCRRSTGCAPNRRFALAALNTACVPDCDRSRDDNGASGPSDCVKRTSIAG